MSNWRKKKNMLETTYTGSRKKAAEFLNADGQLKYSAYIIYKNLYDKDCPYPIRTAPCKVVSAIFILLFIVAMFFTSALKERVALVLNIVFILFSFIAFNSVKNIKYPNEQYSVLYILIISFLAMTLLYLAYDQKDTIISNLVYIKQTLSEETMTIESYEQLLGISNKFVAIACLISVGMLVYGIITGERRFGSVMTPLIIIGGFVLFIFVANFAVSKYADNGNPYLVYLLFIIAIIAMIIFDKFFISRAKDIGGDEPEERGRVHNESE